MPYIVKKVPGGYKVFKQGTDESFSKAPFKVRAKAEAQMAALYAQENKKAAEPGQMLSKDQTNYRLATNMSMCCGNCTHYSPDGSCDIVSGSIRPQDVCDEWMA